MIPTITGPGIRGVWVGKIRSRMTPLVDYELGSAVLNDPTGGLGTHQWVGECDLFGVITVRRYETDAAPTTLLTVPGTEEFAFAFDQNMEPVLVTGKGGTITIHRPTGDVVFSGSYPCACLDERRPEHADVSDVNVSYVRGGKLYCRTQREAYGVERELQSGWRMLTGFAMTTGLRLQWRGRP